MNLSSAFVGLVVAACVVLSAASSIGYDAQDTYEPVVTMDSEMLMKASDKEYLEKKTANFVDLFYETGIPRRISKFIRQSGQSFLDNQTNDPTMNDVNEMFEGRKKDKGGLGAILMMGMMMAKMVGALGFAGVGALAAKALGVSMMALLLSAIVGLKKLAEGGHSGGHSDHHRRRRDLTVEEKSEDSDLLPYLAWFKQE